jgi:spore germination protein PA
MPAIVGAIKIISVGSSAVVNIGDVYVISPSSSAKTFSGGGSFNTGDGIVNENQYSLTNTYDQDVNDQNNVGTL